MNLKEFFSPNYLFKITSSVVTPGEKLFLAAGAVLVLLAVVFKIAAVLSPNPVDKNLRVRFYHLFLTVGVCELVWFLCRFQNARFFGTPFVAWTIVLVGLIWLGFIVTSMVRSYGVQKVNWDKEQLKARYLPKN